MRVAVSGAKGRLGSELIRMFSQKGAEVVPLSRPDFTLEHPSLPLPVDLVINAAAWTDVDACARDPQRALVLNGVAPGRLARDAQLAGARYIQISTNEVFSGRDAVSYVEDAPPDPINAYGMSKLAGERAVRAACPEAVIVRTAWIFGGPNDFPAKIALAAMRMAQEGRPLRVVSDEVGNPTPAGSLASRIVRVAGMENPPPVLHLAGDPPISRYEWATRILERATLPPPEPIPQSEYPRDSAPPLHAVLATGLAQSLGLYIGWQSEGLVTPMEPARR